MPPRQPYREKPGTPGLSCGRLVDWERIVAPGGSFLKLACRIQDRSYQVSRMDAGNLTQISWLVFPSSVLNGND